MLVCWGSGVFWWELEGAELLWVGHGCVFDVEG